MTHTSVTKHNKPIPDVNSNFNNIGVGVLNGKLRDHGPDDTDDVVRHVAVRYQL